MGCAWQELREQDASYKTPIVQQYQHRVFFFFVLHNRMCFLKTYFMNDHFLLSFSIKGAHSKQVAPWTKIYCAKKKLYSDSYSSRQSSRFKIATLYSLNIFKIFCTLSIQHKRLAAADASSNWTIKTRTRNTNSSMLNKFYDRLKIKGITLTRNTATVHTMH